MTDIPPDTSTAQTVSTWRKVLAGILDFFTIFFVAGYVIGYATGNLTAEGFELEGGPAFYSSPRSSPISSCSQNISAVRSGSVS